MSAGEAPLERVRSVMEDPRAEALARVYAGALLGAAGNDVPGMLEELASFLDDVLARNPEFRKLLTSGMLSRDQKLGIIDRVVAPGGSPLLVNFLRVLARHDRLDLLPAIAGEARREWERRCGRGHVGLVAPFPLSDAQSEQIRSALAAVLPFQPILDVQVDPRLLGGLVIRVGDTVYDSSLRTRLKQLRSRLRARSLHEIQSGRDRFCSAEGN
jgi:F-type H+-transporting ATPase subunit delta